MKIILLFLSLLWTGSELMAVEKCDLDIPIEKTQSRKDGNIVVNLYSLPCSNSCQAPFPPPSNERAPSWPLFVAGVCTMGAGVLNSAFFQVFFISKVLKDRVSERCIKMILPVAFLKNEWTSIGLIATGSGMVYHSVTGNLR